MKETNKDFLFKLNRFEPLTDFDEFLGKLKGFSDVLSAKMINQISQGLGMSPTRKIEILNQSKLDSITQSFEMGLDLVRDAFIQMRQLKVNNHSKCEYAISDLENQLIHSHSRIDNLSSQIIEEKKVSEELERRNRDLLKKYREAEVFREKLFRMIQQQESQFKNELQERECKISNTNGSETDEADVIIMSPVKKLKNRRMDETDQMSIPPVMRKDKQLVGRPGEEDDLEPSPVISPIVKRRLNDLVSKNCDRYSSSDEGYVKKNILEDVDEENEEKDQHDDDDDDEDDDDDDDDDDLLDDDDDDDESKQHDFDIKLDMESDYDADESEGIEEREEGRRRRRRRTLTDRLEIDSKINELYPTMSELDTHQKREKELRRKRRGGFRNIQQHDGEEQEEVEEQEIRRSFRSREGKNVISVRDSVAEAEDLYAKVKRDLSTSQFRLFASNIKKLNSEVLSQSETLRNIKKIFGVDKLVLYKELERLVMNKE